jgi:hypothetical protein
LKSLGMTITKYQKEKTNKQTTTTTPQPSWKVHSRYISPKTKKWALGTWKGAQHH